MRRSLHLGLLVAALATGCGKEEEQSPPPLCYEDSDCIGGKFCGFDDRYGAERCLGTGSNGEGGSGGHSVPPSDDTRCGNSPLNGKYLWKVGNCEIGTTVVADPETCSFLLEGNIAGGEGIRSSYDGSHVTFGAYGTFELLRSIASSDLAPDNPSSDCSYDSILPDGVSIEQYRGKYNCALREGNLYSLKGGEGVCLLDNLWKIADSPWPGQDRCREIVRSEGWINNCF